MKGLLVFGVFGFLRRQATPVVLDLGGRLQVFNLGSTAGEVHNTSNVSNTSNASAGSCTSQSCGAGEFCGFAPAEGGAQRSLCKPCAECVEPADSVTFECAACEGYYANAYYQPESVHALSDEELDEFYRYLSDNHTFLPRERARECQEKAGVDFQWAGDRLCDDQTNIEACAWDNGDCCEQPDKPVQTMYCEECQCKDPQSAHFGTKSEPTSRYYYAPGYTDYYDAGIVHHSQDIDEDEAFVYGLKEVFNPCRALEPACRECHENIGHDDSHVWEAQEQCHKTLHCDGTCDACDSCDWWSEDCESKCASCWEAQRACDPCDSSCSSYESCIQEVSGLRSVPDVDDHDICYAPCSECRHCTYEKENATELALCFKSHADAGKCQSCIEAHQSLQIVYTEHMSQCMTGSGPCDSGVLESIAKNATERCAPCWESSVWQDCDPCAGQCEGCETCYDSKTAQIAPTQEVAEAQEEPPMACESECGACGQCVATLGDQSEEAKQICEPLRKEACAECDECWAHPPGKLDPPAPASIEHEAQHALEVAWTERCTALCEKRCWAEPIDDLLASCYCEHDACCEPCLPCRSCTARMDQPHFETALVHAPKNDSHVAKLATVQRANVTRVTAAKLHVVRAFKARRARRATRPGTSSNATVPTARHMHKKHPRPEVLSDLVAGHSRARRGLHVLFKSSSDQVNGTLLSRVLGAESRRARC